MGSPATTPTPGRVRVTPNLFGISFGFAGLGECWSTATEQSSVPTWPGNVAWLLTAVLWLVTVVAYGRNVIRGGRTRTELADVTFGPFVALLTIVPMMLGAALGEHARAAGVTVYLIALVCTILIGGWLSGQWILAETTLPQWHPGYFLPTVAGGLIASIGASSLGFHPLAQLMFGYGVICWLVLGSILLMRLFTAPALPTPLLPTMAIEVAPPVVAGAAWFGLNGGSADAVALGLAGYAMLMVLVQLRLIPAYRTVPFGPGWWSYSFSYAAAFAVGIRWLRVADVRGQAAWTWVLLAIVTAGIAFLTFRTIRALVRNDFLPRPVAIK
ncbi:MAG TPA: hypothetical protein VGJ28_21330 [Micromonosporaceae bacterium]|jgi:tellurite resistance protein